MASAREVRGDDHGAGAVEGARPDSSTMTSPTPSPTTPAEALSTTSRAELERLFVGLQNEARDLFAPRHVPRVASLDALCFQRDWVARNRPVVITEGQRHFQRALDEWSLEGLRRKAGDAEITVAATPNGLADAPVGTEHFCLPEERRMRFGDLLDTPAPGPGDDILYAQYQNSSLTAEFAHLLGDVDADLDWVSAALGLPGPDAINFWCGGDESVTSLHRDPFENIYCVVRGSKTFRLFPPTDVACLYFRPWTLARHRRDAVTGRWDIEPLSPPQTVDWSPVDPLLPRTQLLARFPRLGHAAGPISVTVTEGEMLYLPSGWYHHVTQRAAVGPSRDHGRWTVAINYFYDCDFGARYCWQNFGRGVADLLAGGPAHPGTP